ncbi:pisatin demethylase [Pyronema omphalodes]|nr:pisatin demethylase [Pyronema omphalodes]
MAVSGLITQFLVGIQPLLNLAENNPVATISLILGGFILWFFSSRYNHLSDLPGPFWASITNLYRFFDQWTWTPHLHQIFLHKRYGTFVRYGPNVVSISSAEAIPIIYGINRGFLKSDFYPVQQPISGGRKVEGMFNTTSEKVHAAFRKPVANMYAQSTLIGYEPLVDSTIRMLGKRLDEFADGREMDLGLWLQYFAFDVIGEMTFSKRLGFLETGTDVEGVIAGIEDSLRYSALIGQMPWLDYILRTNPIIRLISAPTSYVVRFAQNRLSERLIQGSEKPPTNDFLSKFLAAHTKDPISAPKSHVFAWTVSNVNAGSDTTAISLRSIFYYLLKNPQSMQKLKEEINWAVEKGIIRKGELVSWSGSQQMPYLEAVIMEAMRLHPVTGTILERVVPKGGREICGRFFKEGTIVGVSPWVVQRDREIYGEDAEEWRPERWTEAGEKERKRMDGAFLGFGAGSRTCIGKNISRLEMFKLVPWMVASYEMELANPNKEWDLFNAWFVKQTGVIVKLRKANWGA